MIIIETLLSKKKKYLEPEEIGTLLLTEQLRRNGHTLETAKALNSPQDPTKWLIEIHWKSEKEYKDFEKWAIKIIMKSTTLREFNKDLKLSRSKETFIWWDLNQGLSVVKNEVQ